MRRTAMWLVALVCLPSVAAAKKYAAMDEVPVEGGELRLVTPVKGGGGREEIAFPLKSVNVGVAVAGPMATYNVEQVFENPYDETIEAIYVFPLGDRSAVIAYEIVVGERTIAGKIETREEARRIYEKAKDDGHTAALLEQDKPNIFQQSVANIAARETVKVRFQYVEPLDYADGEYELIFPLVVGPRYRPSPSASIIPHVDSSVQTYKVMVTASIEAGVPIGDVTSPSHDIEVKTSDTATTVALSTATQAPNRDFVLRWRTAGDGTTVGFLAHRNADSGYFTLVIQPKAKYKTGDIVPREVVILIDVSGSMSGAPLRQAQDVARKIIDTLNERDRLNVIAFCSGTAKFADKPVKADWNGRSGALSWIDGLAAADGTELEQGVIEALAREPGADRVRMVYVLTDGFVGNDESILAAAKEHLGHNRIFPVGVSAAPNRYLLDRLAEVGRGFASYVTPSQEIDEVVAALVKRAAYPYLTDLEIDWAGLDVCNVLPGRIPDVYAGLPLVLTGVYTKPGKATITVKGHAAGRDVEIPLDVDLPAREDQPAVGYAWARARVEELMAVNPAEPDEATRKAVTDIGLAFHMVTQFTSFVAVDTTRVVDGKGKVRTVVQPAPVPEGVDLLMATGEAPAPAAGGYSSSAPSYSHSGGGWSSGGEESAGGVRALQLLLLALGLGVAWLVVRRAAA